MNREAHGDAQTTHDPFMQAYWERVLNGPAYELYFAEELHAAGLHLFDPVAQAQLPVLSALAPRPKEEVPEGRSRNVTDLPEADRLPRLRQKFAELHPVKRDASPLRIALDTIRIIEGRN